MFWDIADRYDYAETEARKIHESDKRMQERMLKDGYIQYSTYTPTPEDWKEYERWADEADKPTKPRRTMNEKLEKLWGFQEDLQEFINIRAQISQLEEKLEELKPRILHDLYDQPKNMVQYEGHTFGIQVRKDYQYSDTIVQMNKDLNRLKKHERDNKIATVTGSKAVLIMK